MDTLFAPFTLPSGSVLPNRIAKAAMEENLAGPGQLPSGPIVELYRRWGQGGAGLIITGNVMVDARALTGPAGIVLDRDTPLEPFTRWAEAAKSGGARVWMQINHPGRQVTADMPGVALSPSGVGVSLGKHSKKFATPTAMTEAEIAATIARFADSARLAEAAGFDGVEIHAAHGYLISQFLSPLSNVRTDRWGGDLENRARLLIEVVTAVRAAVSPGFSVGVKLNSADFQRGGFDSADAERVMKMLSAHPVDLVELSGGTVESPAMQGRAAVDESTLAREAYFLDFAETLIKNSPLPVMITGGVTRRQVAEQVLASGVSVVGMATALAYDPDLPRRWSTGIQASVTPRRIEWRDRTLAALARQAYIRHQFVRLGGGKSTSTRIPPLVAFVSDQARRRQALRRYSAWLPGRTAALARMDAAGSGTAAPQE